MKCMQDMADVDSFVTTGKSTRTSKTKIQQTKGPKFTCESFNNQQRRQQQQQQQPLLRSFSASLSSRSGSIDDSADISRCSSRQLTAAARHCGSLDLSALGDSSSSDTRIAMLDVASANLNHSTTTAYSSSYESDMSEASVVEHKSAEINIEQLHQRQRIHKDQQNGVGANFTKRRRRRRLKSSSRAWKQLQRNCAEEEKRIATDCCNQNQICSSLGGNGALALAVAAVGGANQFNTCNNKRLCCCCRRRLRHKCSPITCSRQPPTILSASASNNKQEHSLVAQPSEITIKHHHHHHTFPPHPSSAIETEPEQEPEPIIATNYYTSGCSCFRRRACFNKCHYSALSSSSEAAVVVAPREACNNINANHEEGNADELAMQAKPLEANNNYDTRELSPAKQQHVPQLDATKCTYKHRPTDRRSNDNKLAINNKFNWLSSSNSFTETTSYESSSSSSSATTIGSELFEEKPTTYLADTERLYSTSTTLNDLNNNIKLPLSTLNDFQGRQQELEQTPFQKSNAASVGASVRPDCALGEFIFKTEEENSIIKKAEDPTLKVMDILRQQRQQYYHPSDTISQPFPPKTFPNNTLLFDLNKCHPNITSFWPHSSSQSSAINSLFSNCWLNFLWPSNTNNNNNNNNEQTNTDTSNGSRRIKRKRCKYTFNMPETLLRTNIKLKLNDYDEALSILTNDIRYKLHLLLYRRIQTIWMLFTTILCILVPVILAVNFESLIIIAACISWLCLQVTGAFVSFKFRKKLNIMLEKSIAQVNSFFVEHNLLLGVINDGSLISKTKLIIPMLYFDTSQCRERIESIISIDSSIDASVNNTKHILDYSKIDLPLTKPTTMAFAQSQLAKKIILRYSQRWISYFDKRKLMFTDDQVSARHLSTGKCLCQFIEEHFGLNDCCDDEATYKAKHNQALTINNNKNNNHKTISFSADESKQHQNETLVKPQVISKRAQMTLSIPTLSRLVSLKEQQAQSENFKIDMSMLEQSSQIAQQTNLSIGNNNNTRYAINGIQSNILINSLQADDVNARQRTRKLNLIAAASNEEVRLDLHANVIRRSDDLIYKLRQLLELKKDDLQDLDGSLFSSVLYKTPTSPLFIPASEDNDNDKVDENEKNRPETEVKNDANETNYSITSKSLIIGKKKFYKQSEGLFFLGTKKNHQHKNDRNNRVLEIC